MSLFWQEEAAFNFISYRRSYMWKLDTIGTIFSVCSSDILVPAID